MTLIAGLPGGSLPEIRQAAASECGLACLAMIECSHGRHTDLATLRREYPVSMKGATSKPLSLGFCCDRTEMLLANCAAVGAGTFGTTSPMKKS